MVFGGFFERKKKTRFECIYNECKSLCCKHNLVVLNEDDVKKIEKIGKEVNIVSEPMGLNEFLKSLGASPIKQLEGLQVLKLKKNNAGECVFHISGDGGCEIYENRPYYCREFPFKFGRGRVKKTDPICPGVGRGDEKSGEQLKRDLGLTDLELKPPLLIGDEDKLKTSRTLMSAVFRLMR